MFELDKEKFGSFISELRKEKGYTQKQLAEQLFVSNKAVSKWETGMSIPDTALLVPLAQLLGVSVTELLMCERVETKYPIEIEKVEDVVKTAITYTDEKNLWNYPTKKKWIVIYVVSVLVGVSCILWQYIQKQMLSSTVLTFCCLGIVFGFYFVLGAKNKLPRYYDENKISVYVDGIFRMHLPGVCFTNKNWPYILLAGRIWSCVITGLVPMISVLLGLFVPSYRAYGQYIDLAVLLPVLLGGLFVPIYVIGMKFEK